jgi:RES domain-containing protein
MHRARRPAGDYAGAMVAGGRWNPIGTPMLYTAEHLALACLEVLVHLDKGQLPRDYVWSKTELTGSPELLIRSTPASVGACQAVGDRWITSGNALAVRVPSAVIPEEFNVLLNPNYAAYASLVWSDPRPFHFDPRLFAAEPQTL